MSLYGRLRRVERIRAVFRRLQGSRWDQLFKAATEEELIRLVELMKQAIEGFPADQEATTWNWIEYLPIVEREEVRHLLAALEKRVQTDPA